MHGEAPPWERPGPCAGPACERPSHSVTGVTLSWRRSKDGEGLCPGAQRRSARPRVRP
ncbi:hypothetical protein KR76_00009 [Pimelobacter simplex]|uniref:Uncharacterized protein n=1 Tax=Nocardioides simplex TaxID=2045 RepID=A0A0C5X9U3_NOCSI|nr:hypothetical protein KR76_00009 [Pimelobacter simplex]